MEFRCVVIGSMAHGIDVGTPSRHLSKELLESVNRWRNQLVFEPEWIYESVTMQDTTSYIGLSSIRPDLDNYKEDVIRAYEALGDLNVC